MRKPGPGMVEQAVREHGIDVRRSLVLGDKPSDRIQYPGLRSAILKSQYSGEDFDVETLEQATRLL
jgi:histidinol phosphatase-like enzyme